MSRLHFGDLVLDLHARQLRQKDAPLHLTPKAFELLAFLVQERPRAVSKQDLQDRLWPGTFVSETSLTTLVNELRKALGEHAREPQYIRTVYGYGYAFCGEVRAAAVSTVSAPAASGATFWLVAGNRQLRLDEGENIVGRNAVFGGFFDVCAVSRRHARIVIAGDVATLEDLGSKNGTYVAGDLITTVTRLADGDEIRFGRARATFRIIEANEPTETLLPSGVVPKPHEQN